MKLNTLKARARTGAIDTVIVAFPDLFGRLLGKRFRADYFLRSGIREGAHGCSYLLTVNLNMDPLTGFPVANWETGFGDIGFRPDLATLRELPWQPATALVLCDAFHRDGRAVAETPRAVLQGQVQRLTQRQFTCQCATELEFNLFNQTYRDACASGYRALAPSSDYRIDYHTMQPARDEPLLRAVRNHMTGAGIPVECSKGEWSRGQHEINFTYAEPVPMADRHVLFKQGVKEIADQHGKAITFMAKYAAPEAGNSCHIHLSLWQKGRNVFWAEPGRAARSPTSRRRAGGSLEGDHSAALGSRLFRQFLGGLMKYSPELCLLAAPTINSYKRYQPGSWAPTRMAWATDNRTVGFRLVGERDGFRIENRMPGADANPYLALAAMIAAGLAGIDERLDCGQEYRGNAYVDSTLARLPSSLGEAADLIERSRLARAAFGDAVVDYLVRHARIEVQAFETVVTDWEQARYFEQI